MIILSIILFIVLSQSTGSIICWVNDDKRPSIIVGGIFMTKVTAVLIGLYIIALLA